MSHPSRSRTAAAGLILLNLVVRTLACSLNVPESVLQNTGSFVLAHVQAVETSVGRTLGPIRLLRQLLTARR